MASFPNPAPGKVFVIYGSGVGFDTRVYLTDADAWEGFVVNGQTGDGLGALTGQPGPVSAVDLNGDGVDDLLIGAPLARGDGGISGILRAGSAYTIFGRDVATEGPFDDTIELSDLEATEGFSIGLSNGFNTDTARRFEPLGDIDGESLPN